MASVRLYNLGKVFDAGRNGKVTAVDGVDLKIPDGELMAVSYTHLTLPTTPYV